MGGRKADKAHRFRVSAPQIEAKVLETVGWEQAGGNNLSSTGALGAADSLQHARGSDSGLQTRRARLHAHVERVTFLANALRIELRSGPDGEAQADLVVPWTDQRRYAQCVIQDPRSGPSEGASIRSEQRARLVQGIANARAWLNELIEGRVPDLETLAFRERCSVRHVRMVLTLAFLPPATVQAAVAGTLPRTCGVVSLSDPPLAWSEPA
jgi:hypothetical protein